MVCAGISPVLSGGEGFFFSFRVFIIMLQIVSKLHIRWVNRVFVREQHLPWDFVISHFVHNFL